jgi:hypothetical protein
MIADELILVVRNALMVYCGRHSTARDDDLESVDGLLHTCG